MKRLLMVGMALLMTGSAFAAPNVTNATQKGSLLIFPDIRVDIDGVEGNWDTIVRIQNDGNVDVDVKCYWMDANKNRVDFVIPITRNQAFWFNAFSGDGTLRVQQFPRSFSNGFDNPFLISPGFTTEDPPEGNSAFYFRGMLACWAVDQGTQNQVKWNHLSGTATVYNETLGAYEYNAYAFFVPTGLDLAPVGVAGTLNLNGVEYDSCPLYQIGQFTPVDVALPADQLPVVEPGVNVFMPIVIWGNRLAVVGCTLNLNQDWTPVWTKLQFDVWNQDEVKFTGAYECSDSWHETAFAPADLFAPINPGADPATTASLAHGPLDAAAQNFQAANLGTFAARYRVQGIKSTQCETTGRVTQAVGVLAVQSTAVSNLFNPFKIDMAGSTLAAAGKFTGKIVWDPAGAVPEGGIR